MYPRNSASPERVSIGAVVLIADGAVQTSGVSITVVPQGGVSAAGDGTISYEQGVVFYTPTQAETNYTSFILTAYKASCLPVSATVVTTASVTPGRTRLESVTHIGATVPTVSDVTNLHASAATVTSQSTAQLDLDILTGADGVTLATLQANYAPNKTVPDAAGTAPTAVDIRQEMDSSSTQLAAILADGPNVFTQNVAFNNFTFLMVDETDHVTAETGLTVSGFISKDGAAFTSLTNSTTEIGFGMYGVNLTQAEMNAKSIILRFTATGADDRLVSIATQPT